MNDLRLKIVDVDGYFALYNDVTSLSIWRWSNGNYAWKR